MAGKRDGAKARAAAAKKQPKVASPPASTSQDIASLDADAQKDLRRAKLDETFGEEMFRFRLAGEQRLWGYRVGQVFHVVWWDWDHKVYPTTKK